MLQQTQASRVARVYRAFLRRFPTVRDLACAPPREVLAAWSGLGYTAAAVASIAYGVPVPALDTNAVRVVARARLGLEPGEAGPRAVREAAERWLHRGDPGAWNQALMDLGREVCRPAPRCGGCPLARACRFHHAGGAAGRGPDGRVATPRGGGALGATEGPGPIGRRQGRAEGFEGSLRQARGAVLRAVLASGGSAPAARIAAMTNVPVNRVLEAAVELARDGLVRVGDGGDRGSGRVRVWVPADPAGRG